MEPVWKTKKVARQCRGVRVALFWRVSRAVKKLHFLVKGWMKTQRSGKRCEAVRGDCILLMLVQVNENTCGADVSKPRLESIHFLMDHSTPLKKSTHE